MNTIVQVGLWDHRAGSHGTSRSDFSEEGVWRVDGVESRQRKGWQVRRGRVAGGRAWTGLWMEDGGV